MFKKLFAFVAVLGGSLYAMGVKAATDTDLEAAIASSTSVLTNNKGAVLAWFATIFGIVVLIVIVKRLLGSAKAQVAGAIGGGRRRR